MEGCHCHCRHGCCSLGWDWWCCIITWHNNVIFVSYFEICINDVIFDGFIWQNILKNLLNIKQQRQRQQQFHPDVYCAWNLNTRFLFHFYFLNSFFIVPWLARSVISHLALRLPHFPAEHSFASLLFCLSLSRFLVSVCIFLVQSLPLHVLGSAQHDGIRRFDGIWNKKYWQKK